MKKNVILILFLLLINYVSNAQIYDESAIISKIADNLVDVFKNQIKNQTQKMQVVVFPFTDSNGNTTEKGKQLAKKLAAELSNKIHAKQLNFNIQPFDADLTIDTFITNHSNKAKIDDPEYYNKLWESNNVNYIIVADYYENNSILNIENVFVHRNYVIFPPKESWSPKGVQPKIEVNKIAFTKSFFPGMGQFYKKQNSKGTIFTTASITTIASSFVFVGLKQYNHTKAINNPYSTSYADAENFCQMLSIGSFICFGIFYTVNLIDARSSEPKFLKTYAFQNIKLYPEYCFNQKYLCLNIRF